MLPSAKKDSVPTTQKSCVIYEFSCRCEARYVGRTFFFFFIIHLKQRYPFSKIQLTKSKTKNIKNSNPINLIFQGVVLEGA